MLCGCAMRQCVPDSTSPFSFSSLSCSYLVLFSLNMATDKPLLLSAILGSKNAIALMMLFPPDRDLDIKVEGDIENGKWITRSQYSVWLFVADKEVMKSTKSKPRSSELKWEWIANNQMWVLVLWLTSWLIFISWNQLVWAIVKDEGGALPWIRNQHQSFQSSRGTVWGEHHSLAQK